jgi:hypothetical protein
MKLNSSNVIQVTQEGEETTTELVVPHLDLVVVSTRHDERLVEMKVHTAYRAIVFLEAINDSSHAVVPSETTTTATSGSRVSDGHCFSRQKRSP